MDGVDMINATISVTEPSEHYQDQHWREKATVSFLHNFPRFGGAPKEFSPHDPHYAAYLQFLSLLCFSMGMIMLWLLCLIIVRRFYCARRNVFSIHYAFSTDVPAVMLLGLTAMGSLVGLIGQAQVDYSVRVTTDAIYNSSITVNRIYEASSNFTVDAEIVLSSAIDMLAVHRNDSLPEELVSSLIVDVDLLRNSSAPELAALVAGLPPDLALDAESWEFFYFWVKRGTSFVILLVALVTLSSITAIGWSLRSSLRISMALLLALVPISTAVLGIYLSSSVAGADFCVSPEENAIKLFGDESSNSSVQIVDHFIHCKNQSVSYANVIIEAQTHIISALESIHKLENFSANHHHEFPNLQPQYLSPMNRLLMSMVSTVGQLDDLAVCKPVRDSFVKATELFCDYGVVGQFSLWVHQVSISFFLFLCVIAVLSVWDRVHARDQRAEMQYSLLSSYNEDNLDHAFLTPE